MVSLFKVLGSDKRKKMLELLRKEETHVSGLARMLNISVPVALKHVKLLEEAGLVVRTKVGSTHILRIAEDKVDMLSNVWMLFDEPVVLEVKKGATLSDALKPMKEIRIKKSGYGSYIDCVDGREGFFVYEVDGRIVDMPINKYFLRRDVEVEIKRLVPALDKKIKIKVLPYLSAEKRRKPSG